MKRTTGTTDPIAFTAASAGGIGRSDQGCEAEAAEGQAAGPRAPDADAIDDDAPLDSGPTRAPPEQQERQQAKVDPRQQKRPAGLVEWPAGIARELCDHRLV